MVSKIQTLSFFHVVLGARWRSFPHFLQIGTSERIQLPWVFLEYVEWVLSDCHRMLPGFLTHPGRILAGWMCPELLSSAILSKVPASCSLFRLRKLTLRGRPDFSADYLCLFQPLSRAHVIYSCISWAGLPELLAGVLRSWAPLRHHFLGASTHTYPSLSLHFAFMKSLESGVQPSCPKEGQPEQVPQGHI